MKVVPFVISGLMGGIAKAKGIVIICEHTIVFQYTVSDKTPFQLLESGLKEIEVPFECISHIEYEKPLFDRPKIKFQFSDLNVALQFPKQDRGQIELKFDSKDKKLARELVKNINQSITNCEIDNIIKQADNVHQYSSAKKKEAV